MITVTGRMIHEAYLHIEPTATAWTDASYATRAKYREMAEHLNALAELCPFCQFYERVPQKIGSLCIADIPACTDCAEATIQTDITEMLLKWLGEQS